ncbi:MAG: AEC family transporter [Halobacteriaceae archaeon]
MTASVVDVFVGTLLPVLSIAGAGYVLGQFRDLDVGPLNTVTLYLLLPALILHSLLTTPLGGDAAVRLFGAIAAFTLVMLGLSYGVGRALGLAGTKLNALVLAASFPNVGNFGIPVSEFAFGETGRTTAVLFVAGQQVFLYTLGVYVASSGRYTTRGALRQVVSLPLLYVVALGVVVNAAGAAPPAGGTAMRTLELVGNASIPVFLVVLGLELAEANPAAAWQTTPAVALKVLVAPAIGLAVALAVGFEEPLVARTFALETAAPVAITPLALLVEFSSAEGAEGVSGPAYLSTTILLTTLGAIPVVTVLIAALRGGALL